MLNACSFYTSTHNSILTWQSLVCVSHILGKKYGPFHRCCSVILLVTARLIQSVLWKLANKPTMERVELIFRLLWPTIIYGPMAARHTPWHPYVHLPKDIVAGHLNHNCDISNSTIVFYLVIFLLYLLQLSFYNCIKLMRKDILKL